MLEAKINDLFKKCEKYASPVFSKFLDAAELSYIKNNIRCPYGLNSMVYGGTDDYERGVYGVFPEWQEPDTKDFPVSLLRITPGYDKKTLSHRDYLGTLMSLGFERNMIGDIIIYNGSGYVFVLDDISDYVKNNLSKISNVGVKVQDADAEELSDRKPDYTLGSIIAASMRLDAVAAGALGKSRSTAAALIKGGKVKVNHIESLETARELKEGDIISVRGFGRFAVDEISGETRSGRLHIMIKKFALK